jgi:hypothetical protein
MTNPTISIAPSGNLLVEFPSVLAEGRSHSVEIPFTLAGLSALKRALVARKETAVPRIGSHASPVASDIQKYLADRAREERVVSIQHARTIEKKYQIENLDLEL